MRSRNDRAPARLPEPKRREKTGVGRVLQKAVENPTLVIAGLAAVPLLFLVWGATRRWREKRIADEETE